MGATLQFLSHPYLSQAATSDIRVLRFQYHEQVINCDPGLEVEVESKLALTSVEGLLGSVVQFVDRGAAGGEAAYFNGTLDALQTMPLDVAAREIAAHRYQYRLTVRSGFDCLKTQQHDRVFQDVSLSGMLSSVFEGAGIARQAYAFHFKRDRDAPLIAAATQLGESDYDFMLRHVVQHDLFFIVRHEKQGSVLHIADSLASLPFCVTQKTREAFASAEQACFKTPPSYLTSEVMAVSPPMDRQGRYFIANHAAALPCLQPYGGAEDTVKIGLHFPLQIGNKTVCQCIDNDIDQTVIVGSLFTEDNFSPVTSHNPHDMILRTGEGNQLRFSDFPVPCIELNTVDQKNQVGLYESEETSYMDVNSAEGALQITAAKDIQVLSQGAHTQQVAGNYEASVKGDHILHVKGEPEAGSRHCLQATDVLALQAGEDCLFNTTAHLRLETQQGEMQVDVGQDLTWQAGGEVYLAAPAGSAVCEVGGDVRLQAGQAVSLTTPGSSVSLAPEVLDLRADHLQITAQEIIVEAIDFKVN